MELIPAQCPLVCVRAENATGPRNIAANKKDAIFCF